MIILQNNSHVNACNSVLAIAAPTQIHCNACGFLISEDNVTKNQPKINTTTIPHQIANFLKEKLLFAHFFTSVGLFTCT